MGTSTYEEAVNNIMLLTRMLHAICTQMEENIGTPFTETVLKNAQARMLPEDRNLLLWWNGTKLVTQDHKG